MTDRAADAAVQAQQLFDSKASTWSANYAPGSRLAGRLTLFTGVLSHHTPAGGDVLDLGCGTGELACAAAAAGMRVAGCDISSQMLYRAAIADSSATVNWVQLKPGWRKLPFESATFDVVIAASVLEYVDDPTAVLRECCRVLRAGGTVLCTVPNLHHPIRWLEWLLGMAGWMPPVRLAGRCWPRLDSYLTYLRISRQRHSDRWWHAAAARADLRDTRYRAYSAGRSALRLLTFQRTDAAGDC